MMPLFLFGVPSGQGMSSGTPAVEYVHREKIYRVCVGCGYQVILQEPRPWMGEKFIESKIKDPNIMRLVRRMLKAGIMEDYQLTATETGSGQGSVCSPVIANIYMHYVLVWWFKEKIQPKAKGFCGLVVYADDFVVCFQYKWEAERFYQRLKRRMEYFGLELQEDKSRLIKSDICRQICLSGS